jgi:hypothetical protein
MVEDGGSCPSVQQAGISAHCRVTGPRKRKPRFTRLEEAGFLYLNMAYSKRCHKFESQRTIPARLKGNRVRPVPYREFTGGSSMDAPPESSSFSDSSDGSRF